MSVSAIGDSTITSQGFQGTKDELVQKVVGLWEQYRVSNMNGFLQSLIQRNAAEGPDCNTLIWVCRNFQQLNGDCRTLLKLALGSQNSFRTIVQNLPELDLSTKQSVNPWSALQWPIKYPSCRWVGIMDTPPDADFFLEHGFQLDLTTLLSHIAPEGEVVLRMLDPTFIARLERSPMKMSFEHASTIIEIIRLYKGARTDLIKELYAFSEDRSEEISKRNADEVTAMKQTLLFLLSLDVEEADIGSFYSPRLLEAVLCSNDPEIVNSIKKEHFLRHNFSNIQGITNPEVLKLLVEIALQ